MSTAPTWYIDRSDESRSGLYFNLGRKDPVPSLQRFIRDLVRRQRIGVVDTVRKGMSGVFEMVDLTAAQLEVGIGIADQPPTFGTWPLQYDLDPTGLTTLAYNISEADLETAVNANPSLSLIGVITADAGTDAITFGADHGLNIGDRVRFTNLGGGLPAPLVAGTYYYVKSVPSETTITLSTTLGGALLNLTTAGTGTHSIYGYVEVTKSGSAYYTLRFPFFGARVLLTSPAVSNFLRPESAVIIARDQAGDAATRDVQTIELAQKPFAFTGPTGWTLLPSGTVAASTIFAGDNSTPAQFRILFSEPPVSGSVRIVHSVPQIAEFTVTANTATVAQFELDFGPVLGNEVDFNGRFVDAYAAGDVITRFWFNHTGESPASPGSPPGAGTLVQVDYTNVSNLVAAFVAAAAAQSIFTGGVVQQSSTKVRVTYAAKGYRTSVNIATAPPLNATTSIMRSNGSDGAHVGRYLFNPNRLGVDCIYFRGAGGYPVAEPNITAIPINRYIPVNITIDGAASVIANDIATALNSDDEYDAAASGNTVTVTDEYGGARATVTAAKTVSFGVAIRRPGSSVNQAVPWTNPPETIKDQLGNLYHVSKPNELTWILTRTVNGAMPDMSATGGEIKWQSLMEGVINFSKANLHAALSSTTEPSLNCIIEVALTPSGGERDVILQLPCQIDRNLLLIANLASATWPEALLSLKTGNLLWVDKVNGSPGTALRGRLDLPFLSCAAARAAAMAGDTIIVLPGIYTETENLAKDEVDWELITGVTIECPNGVGENALFDDSAGSNFNVRGRGRFVMANAGSSGAPIVKLSNSSSNVRFEAEECRGNSANALFDIVDGSLRVRVENSLADAGNFNPEAAFRIDAGTLIIEGGDHETEAGAGALILTGSGTARIELRGATLKGPTPVFYDPGTTGKKLILKGHNTLVSPSGSSPAIYATEPQTVALYGPAIGTANVDANITFAPDAGWSYDPLVT